VIVVDANYRLAIKCISPSLWGNPNLQKDKILSGRVQCVIAAFASSKFCGAFGIAPESYESVRAFAVHLL